MRQWVLQDPLPHRDLWKDLINQMGCRLHHASGIAGGTDSASFTREGDEKIASTAGTSCSGKAMPQDATRQIVAEIPLELCSNRGTLLIRLPKTGQPGFQMTLHHLINHAALRQSAPINRSAKCALRRGLGTGRRSHNPIRE